MNKFFGGIAAAAALVSAVLMAPVAQAETRYFSFQSSTDDVKMSGVFNITGDVITSMKATVYNTVFGKQSADNVVVNVNSPAIAYSPDGKFYYDNIFAHSNPALDIGGVLFTTSANTDGYWNLWGTGPNAGALWASSSNGAYVVQEYGTLNVRGVSGVPELSTWAMMMLGFGALGFAATRRKELATA